MDEPDIDVLIACGVYTIGERQRVSSSGSNCIVEEQPPPPHCAFTQSQLCEAIVEIEAYDGYFETKNMFVATGICGPGSEECIEAVVDGVMLASMPEYAPQPTTKSRIKSFFKRILSKNKKATQTDAFG